jgi:hypothetical protein
MTAYSFITNAETFILGYWEDLIPLGFSPMNQSIFESLPEKPLALLNGADKDKVYVLTTNEDVGITRTSHGQDWVLVCVHHFYGNVRVMDNDAVIADTLRHVYPQTDGWEKARLCLVRKDRLKGLCVDAGPFMMTAAA